MYVLPNDVVIAIDRVLSHTMVMVGLGRTRRGSLVKKFTGDQGLVLESRVVKHARVLEKNERLPPHRRREPAAFEIDRDDLEILAAWFTNPNFGPFSADEKDGRDYVLNLAGRERGN